MNTKAGVSATLAIKVIRANGTVEDLGIVGDTKPSLKEKILKKLGGK